MNAFDLFVVKGFSYQETASTLRTKAWMDTKEARGLCTTQHKISLIDRCFSLLFEDVDMLLMCLSMRDFFLFKPGILVWCDRAEF